MGVASLTESDIKRLPQDVSALVGATRTEAQAVAYRVAKLVAENLELRSMQAESRFLYGLEGQY